LHVDIFLDATLSMQGFVNPGTSTYYAQLLPLLESAVTSGWSDQNIRFFKFGTQTPEIRIRQEFLRAGLPIFYTYEEGFKETSVDKVIDFENANTNENRLKVIVTDLFQNDSDVNLLTKKLKEQYIAKNLAVGILGVKSQFNGTVYDVGIERDKFDYSSNDKTTESLRPFYVLILGKHSNIAHYYERLRLSGLKEFNTEKNFIIFSQYLVHPISSFEGAKIESSHNITLINELFEPGKEDNRVKQFRVKSDDKEAAFNAKVKYNPLLNTVDFNIKDLIVEVTGMKYQGDKFAASDKANNSIIVKPVSLANLELALDFKLLVSNLQGKGIYSFEIALHPKPESYSMPKWISEWDMDIGKIDDWRKEKKQFKGNTTLNLSRFINDLWQTTVQVHKHKIARLYCYIKKE
jgi:hypothetical protein